VSGASDLSAAWEGAPTEEWRRRWRIPRLDVYARTGSTNDAARTLAERGAPAGTTVIAEEQTAGRGRMGRTWSAPPGRALLLSVILRPRHADPRDARPGTAPLRVALAVARALDRAAGLEAGIKWPNDIVIPGAGKLAGILCEASLARTGTEYIVAGVGVNTGQAAADFPPDLASLATSVLLAGGHADRAALAGELLEALRPFDARDLRPLDDEELAEIGARDVLRGAAIQVDGGAVAGTAAGIAEDGALLVANAAGTGPVHFGTVRVREAGPRAARRTPRSRNAPREPSPEGNA
jgi:BirA family biotin operon repressor/biotin-[acetyl-CoA-carboxylase] ligase